MRQRPAAATVSCAQVLSLRSKSWRMRHDSRCLGAEICGDASGRGMRERRLHRRAFAARAADRVSARGLGAVERAIRSFEENGPFASARRPCGGDADADRDREIGAALMDDVHRRDRPTDVLGNRQSTRQVRFRQDDGESSPPWRAATSRGRRMLASSEPAMAPRTSSPLP